MLVANALDAVSVRVVRQARVSVVRLLHAEATGIERRICFIHGSPRVGIGPMRVAIGQITDVLVDMLLRRVSASPVGAMVIAVTIPGFRSSRMRRKTTSSSQ